MFHVLIFLLFSSLIVHSKDFFECRQVKTTRSFTSDNFPVSCGGGEEHEGFWARVRMSDIKTIKVNVKDSYTGQTKQLSFPFKNKYIDSYYTADNYIKIEFRTDELARDHGLKGPVNFVSYELSPDIYVGYNNQRFKLSDLFNEHRKPDIVCVYREGKVNMISAGFCNKQICYGDVDCHDEEKNRTYKASVVCKALKRDTCPEATACFLSEDEVTVKNVADNSEKSQATLNSTKTSGRAHSSGGSE